MPNYGYGWPGMGYGGGYGYGGYPMNSWGANAGWYTPGFLNRPAASSFDGNYWLGLANNSAINVNYGRPPAGWGLPSFLRGGRYYY